MKKTTNTSPMRTCPCHAHFLRMTSQHNAERMILQDDAYCTTVSIKLNVSGYIYIYINTLYVHVHIYIYICVIMDESIVALIQDA